MSESAVPDLTDLAILNALQDDLPLVSRPFELIAGRLGMPEDDVIRRVRGLQERGIIRGISPVLESRQAGLSATTLVAIRVPDEKIRDVTRPWRVRLRAKVTPSCLIRSQWQGLPTRIVSTVISNGITAHRKLSLLTIWMRCMRKMQLKP